MKNGIKGHSNFSHNNVSIDNNVSIKANLAYSAGPAMMVLSIVFGAIVLTLFGIAVVCHWGFVRSATQWVLIGIGIFFVVKALLHISHGGIDVYEHFEYARGQRKRNAVLAMSDGQSIVDREVAPLAAINSVREIKESTTYRYDNRGEDAIEGEATVLELPVPGMSTLIQDGTIERIARENRELPINKKKLVLGYVNGQLEIGTFYDLRSCGFGGAQGQGKTSTMTFYSYQAALYGFKLIVIDPHMHHEEEGFAPRLKPVRSALMGEPVCDEEQEMLKRVRFLQRQLDARKKKDGMRNAIPIICIMDELNSVMRSFTTAESKSIVLNVLLNIAQEGRKFGLFIFAAGQTWQGSSIGGANVRQSFPSRLAHRMETGQIKLLLDCTETEIARLIGDVPLRPGQALLSTANGELKRIVLPKTERDDGIAISNLMKKLGVGRPNVVEVSEISETPETARNGVISEISDYRNMSETAWEAKVERVSEMRLSGGTQRQIITEIWGAKPGDNALYRQAKEEYDTIVALLDREHVAMQQEA